MTAAEAMRRRRSHSSVDSSAPSHKELLKLVETASSIADHASLRPWRVIELRGSARERLGAALAEAAGDSSPSTKPLRASLLLAIVFSPRPSGKVPHWEQEAVASGIAHALSLLLDEAGWGVFWRTGLLVRSGAVHRMHELEPDEQLLGWLYVGGKPDKKKSGHRKLVDPRKHLSKL